MERTSAMDDEKAGALAAWCASSAYEERWRRKAVEARRESRSAGRHLLAEGAWVAAKAGIRRFFLRDGRGARELQRAFIAKAIAKGGELKQSASQADDNGYRDLALAWSVARVQAHSRKMEQGAPAMAQELGLALRAILGAHASADWSTRFSMAWGRSQEAGVSLGYRPSKDLPTLAEVGLATLQILAEFTGLDDEELAIHAALEASALSEISGLGRGGPRRVPLRM